MNLSVTECQILWVVGAAERLATLGMFGGDVPLRIPNSRIELYLELDEQRDLLFESNFEIYKIFKSLVEEYQEEETDSEDLQQMVDLLVEYKENRTELVKYALSHAMA